MSGTRQTSDPPTSGHRPDLYIVHHDLQAAPRLFYRDALSALLFTAATLLLGLAGVTLDAWPPETQELDHPRGSIPLLQVEGINAAHQLLLERHVPMCGAAALIASCQLRSWRCVDSALPEGKIKELMRRSLAP